MVQNLKNIKANAIVSATSSITTSTNIGGNLLPTGNLTYDIGSNTARWKDLFNLKFFTERKGYITSRSPGRADTLNSAHGCPSPLENYCRSACITTTAS
jgi:hypothetical protein